MSLPEFSPLHSLLTSGPYTQVFGALGAESSLDVGPPDTSVLTARVLAVARRSVVKVEGIAPSCSRRIEGSGFVIAPDRVLTNAHVVAGVDQGPEVLTSKGRQFAARVVLYDPRRDIAVLDVPGLGVPPLAFASPGSARRQTRSSSAIRSIRASPPSPRASGRLEAATGPDIYQTAQVTRQIYPIRAVVEPGNSGGPLLAPDGRVYGVVFAAAVAVPDTGYALTAAEIAPDVRRGVRQSRAASPPRPASNGHQKRRLLSNGQSVTAGH